MDLIAESGRTLTRMLSFERKRVFTFQQGDYKNYRLLGRKGAALCELTQLGFPVPPGFVITTENFLEYVNHGEELRPELISSVINAIHGIERETGRKFGKPSADGTKLPLLFAIRAGTAVVIPGIMDTILNVGMSDQVVHYLLELNPGFRRFALDLHRRFLYQYGILVLRNPAHKYEKILTQARDRDHVTSNDKLSVDALTFIVSEYRRITQVPEDPFQQLRAVIEAMYQHSYSPRVSQSLEDLSSSEIKIPRALAITVQAMVYGNLNRDSGSGVAFSRRPGGSSAAPVGEFLVNAEGKEVLDGHRRPTPMEDLMTEMPEIYEKLIRYMRKLERLEQEVQYVEFTVENGVLYLLETSSVNLHPNLKDSRYVVYDDFLLHLQQQEEADEEDSKHSAGPSSSFSSFSDAKHEDSKTSSDSDNKHAAAAPLLYREGSDGTYDMDARPQRRGSKVEPGLDEILEEESHRITTAGARRIHK